jgi:hypothetical protein
MTHQEIRKELMELINIAKNKTLSDVEKHRALELKEKLINLEKQEDCYSRRCLYGNYTIDLNEKGNHKGRKAYDFILRFCKGFANKTVSKIQQIYYDCYAGRR